MAAEIKKERDSRRPVQYGEAIKEDPPDTPWLLEGIIPAASISIIAAEGGVGKSTLMAQMGLAMASGVHEFFGFAIPNRVRVLYLQAEGARHVFIGRLKVAGHHLGCISQAAEIPFFVQPRGDWIKDIGPETERMVEETKAQFCVIDTQGLYHAGDENDNTEIKQFLIKPLQAIAARTGCAFMLIHHLGKPNKDRSGGRHRIRGASAFVDDTDLSMMLEAPDGIKESRRDLVFTKNRNGAHPQDIALEYVSAEARFIPFDETGAEAAKEEERANFHRKHIAQVADRMYDVIRTMPNLNATKIYDLMGPGRRKDFIEAKALLLTGNKIFAEESGRKNEMTYYIGNK